MMPDIREGPLLTPGEIAGVSVGAVRSVHDAIEAAAATNTTMYEIRFDMIRLLRQRGPPVYWTLPAARRSWVLRASVAGREGGVAEEARTRGFAAPAFAGCAFVEIDVTDGELPYLPVPTSSSNAIYW